jgi:uncharacterized protein (TIGR02246 family)
MKKTSLTSVCLLAAFLFAVNNAGAQTKDELKAKIEKLNKEMGDAMVSGNSEKSLSFYTKDAISMPNFEPMSEGIEAIKKANDEMMKKGSKVTSFEATTLEVKTYGNIITEIGKYKISMTMAGKTDPMQDMGKYLTIWEKQKDGSLKIKVEIWNTDNNPMAKMDKMENMEKK